MLGGTRNTRQELELHFLKSAVVTVLVLGAILYMALMSLLYFFQRNLQYHPDTALRSPESLGLSGISIITFKAADDETIVAWHKPALTGRPTIMYFHGNGGSVSTRPKKIATYAASNYGLLAVSYRGYGGSTGSPSERGFLTDAEAAYVWLKSQGVSENDILVVGESIGTGVAVQFAAKHRIRAMALEAPFANAVDIGAAAYWYLPVRLLMHDQFRSADYIASVKVPLWITHGTDDQLIPFAQGQKLFSLANDPKTFVAVQGGTHDIIGDQETWKREIEFFERVLNSPAAQ